ncbi:MAG: Txe/YoeB family addiction module toxin [Anaerolineae bacterium]|nr:Txe/YoeB family addiction module toxin [Anaerolineae bacterium]MCB0243651.1 Txe/YoeB family addiction module toxin [Anaerolineae bacterium]MCB1736463.1 Txe/YoeB family addiction module toxin [Gammaproteobacteria bacterium]MCB9131560.1 Txe/YoeB family addiction module toxin [Anaerolineales bacterium]MCO5243773.1 Txe/YoeB family addiction module toxin [Anaerolineae bacterium]
MIYQFSANAWDDYLYWQETDRKMMRRINRLIKDAARSPSEGIGKPEPLRHNLAGWWSRRIDEEHRMVYRVNDDVLEIAQLRHHYE